MNEDVTLIKLKNAKGEEKEIKFASLPPTALTLKYLAPILKKKSDQGENISSLINAISHSLSINYNEEEVEEILDCIPVVGEDTQLLNQITECIFRNLK
jgi:hypothetical protein